MAFLESYNGKSRLQHKSSKKVFFNNLNGELLAFS